MLLKRSLLAWVFLLAFVFTLSTHLSSLLVCFKIQGPGTDIIPISMYVVGNQSVPITEQKFGAHRLVLKLAGSGIRFATPNKCLLFRTDLN